MSFAKARFAGATLVIADMGMANKRNAISQVALIRPAYNSRSWGKVRMRSAIAGAFIVEATISH